MVPRFPLTKNSNLVYYSLKLVSFSFKTETELEGRKVVVESLDLINQSQNRRWLRDIIKTN